MVYLFYTSLISVDLAQYEIFELKIAIAGKGGINKTLSKGECLRFQAVLILFMAFLN